MPRTRDEYEAECDRLLADWMIRNGTFITTVMDCHYDGVDRVSSKVIYGLSHWPSYSELLFEYAEYG
jgi:hypothetical protein